MDFSKRMQPVNKESIFKITDEFYVWCGTITQSDDGLFYLYFSFWPKSEGGEAWVTHSKIGYAVSESMTGPYTFEGIALSGAGGSAWDRDCVHNPAVLKVDGMYYIYYMGNYGDGTFWNNRNNQRIGVAYSKDPKGPFVRLDDPVLDVTEGSFDDLMTSNPTVCLGPDKKIYMMYKAVSSEGEMPKGGAVICGMAVAKHPLGPFEKKNQPILVNPENPWSVEDPFIWYEGDRFYALAKDFQGYFIKEKKFGVALFESADGFDWKPSENPLAFCKELQFEDGSIQELDSMERPQMWLDEEGRPRVLSCACLIRYTDSQETFNVQIEIK